MKPCEEIQFRTNSRMIQEQMTFEDVQTVFTEWQRRISMCIAHNEDVDEHCVHMRVSTDMEMIMDGFRFDVRNTSKSKGQKESAR